MGHLVVDLGWVEFVVGWPTSSQPNSAGADENQAVLAEQGGGTVQINVNPAQVRDQMLLAVHPLL